MGADGVAVCGGCPTECNQFLWEVDIIAAWFKSVKMNHFSSEWSMDMFNAVCAMGWLGEYFVQPSSRRMKLLALSPRYYSVEKSHQTIQRTHNGCIIYRNNHSLSHQCQ